MLQYYTSYDQIRAVVALSVEELPDDVLSQPVYEAELYEAFTLLGDTFETRFAEVLAITSKTRNQERFIRLGGLFATYSIAVQLVITLPMAPQSIEDGRAKMTRFNFDQTVIAGIQAAYSATTSKLLALFGTLYPGEALEAGTASAFTVVLSGATGLATDPVVA